MRWMLLVGLLWACGDDSSPADSGGRDSGSSDGSSGDVGARDVGARDTGSLPDVGARDAGDTCDPGPVTVTEANASLPPTADHAEIFAGRCGAAVGQIFPPSAPWNQSVRNTCVDPRSDAIVNYLAAVVEGGQTFRIDMGRSTETFGFNPLLADASIEERMFSPTGDFFATACDEALVPVPPDGRLEGESGYDCESDGDCHLLVHDTEECLLFEMWRADDALGSFPGGCLAVWQSDEAPETDLRGLGCTSADAAGLPITPMLVTPGEVVRGGIRHALRFILPNRAVQRDNFVPPATHNPLRVSRFGEPDPGPAGTMPPPYGVRLRLRPDFPVDGLSPAAAAMVEALKEYGMFHADGGNVTFIASNSSGSGIEWDDPRVGLGPNELRDAGIAWTDFEVVNNLDGVVSMEDVDCSRTPLDEF
ncbi:MAG: hypothetical protein AAGE52_13405 [Myxococcota bacterium]